MILNVAQQFSFSSASDQSLFFRLLPLDEITMKPYPPLFWFRQEEQELLILNPLLLSSSVKQAWGPTKNRHIRDHDTRMNRLNEYKLKLIIMIRDPFLHEIACLNMMFGRHHSSHRRESEENLLSPSISPKSGYWWTDDDVFSRKKIGCSFWSLPPACYCVWNQHSFPEPTTVGCGLMLMIMFLERKF